MSVACQVVSACNDAAVTPVPMRIRAVTARRLIHLEIAAALPAGDVLAEGVPLATLGFYQTLEDVIAERAAHHLVPFHLINGLPKGGGQGGDVAAAKIVVGEVVEVLFHWLR